MEASMPTVLLFIKWRAMEAIGVICSESVDMRIGRAGVHLCTRAGED